MRLASISANDRASRVRREKGRPLTRSLIIEHVWDIHFDSISNVVEVHINSLRNKIDRGYGVQLIHTVRGVGYMLTDAPS